jgi:protein-tyrosine kinase
VSKIYEALEQAQRVQKREDSSVMVRPAPSAIILPAIEPSELDMEREMITLYQNIESILPDLPKKVIQFMGSREGEGTSTIIREFARISATRLGKRVILLDADRQHPIQHLLFNIHPEYGWEDALGNGISVEKTAYQIGTSTLFLSPVSPCSVSIHQIFDSPRLKDFFETLRQIFDLVIIDSPPAVVSPDGISISRMVDGVVLVVEAEKTRWPVVGKVRDNIIRNGGKILGMVLNKRRHYIPGIIYERL